MDSGIESLIILCNMKQSIKSEYDFLLNIKERYDDSCLQSIAGGFFLLLIPYKKGLIVLNKDSLSYHLNLGIREYILLHEFYMAGDSILDSPAFVYEFK